jgi:hypothetical protein
MPRLMRLCSILAGGVTFANHFSTSLLLAFARPLFANPVPLPAPRGSLRDLAVSAPAGLEDPFGC